MIGSMGRTPGTRLCIFDLHPHHVGVSRGDHTSDHGKLYSSLHHTVRQSTLIAPSPMLGKVSSRKVAQRSQTHFRQGKSLKVHLETKYTYHTLLHSPCFLCYRYYCHFH